MTVSRLRAKLCVRASVEQTLTCWSSAVELLFVESSHCQTQRSQHAEFTLVLHTFPGCRDHNVNFITERTLHFPQKFRMHHSWSLFARIKLDSDWKNSVFPPFPCICRVNEDSFRLLSINFHVRKAEQFRKVPASRQCCVRSPATARRRKNDLNNFAPLREKFTFFIADFFPRFRQKPWWLDRIRSGLVVPNKIKGLRRAKTIQSACFSVVNEICFCFSFSVSAAEPSFTARLDVWCLLEERERAKARWSRS